MRICCVIASMSAGGAERVMNELCRAWADRGDEVVLITLSSADSDFFAVPPRVERRALELASVSRSASDAIRANATRIARLRRAILSERPEVVVSFTDRTNVLVLLATIGLPVPVLVSERTDPRMNEPGRSWRGLRRLLYPRADGLVVQTVGIVTWACGLLPASRVHVIANPVRTVGEVCHAAGDRALRVMALGRLVPDKGFHMLVTAFAATRVRHPEWRLVIYGEGPERAALLLLAQQLGIADVVSLPGRTATPDAELAASSIFALTSRYEGFPNALLEAMAAGCACISTACPSGPAELIRHEVGGLLVPVGDTAAMSAGLQRLMSDAALRTRFSLHGRAESERFGIEDIVLRWDRAFASAAQSRAAA